MFTFVLWLLVLAHQANAGVMSATVQLNFIVKSIAGLVTAGISDYIGRRPVTLICLSLLLVGGFKDVL